MICEWDAARGFHGRNTCGWFEANDRVCSKHPVCMPSESGLPTGHFVAGWICPSPFCGADEELSVGRTNSILQAISVEYVFPFVSLCSIDYITHKSIASFSFSYSYTYLQKENPTGKVTESAHPARFSPDDKFSSQRVACKKRFGIYLPDSPQKPM